MNTNQAAFRSRIFRLRRIRTARNRTSPETSSVVAPYTITVFGHVVGASTADEMAELIELLPTQGRPRNFTQAVSAFKRAEGDANAWDGTVHPVDPITQGHL